MKKFLLQFFAIFLFFSSALHAEKPKNFPNLSGNVLYQIQADRVISTQKNGVDANNAFVYIEPNLSLNFNRNWSIKTDWRIQPNHVLTTRDSTNSERYRTFLQSNRGLNLSNTGVIVEELKLNFENEDLRFFAGKFDPTFGTAWRKAKRIGVFAAQFNEDYNLREKIGAGITALLENSNLSFNGFFNDTTGLSRSAIDDRGRASSNNGIAGNTGTLSSYSVSMEGERFFAVDNWFYNVGYRSLGVSQIAGTPSRAREQGYVFGSEYLYKLGHQTSLIPFIELVKIDNFTGEKNRDAKYTTLALIGKYSSWTSSISFVHRNIKQPQRTANISDRQLQFSVGYKFTDNLTLDVSRADIKENGYTGSLLGVTMSYLYKF